jgi:hypothetical protein
MNWDMNSICKERSGDAFLLRNRSRNSRRKRQVEKEQAKKTDPADAEKRKKTGSRIDELKQYVKEWKEEQVLS